MKRNTWIWWAAGGVLLILLIILIDKAEDVLAHIDYPLDVWRMDMDDALVAALVFSAIGTGIAGFASLWKKADRAQRKADLVYGRINGGYVELLGRVTKIEEQRDHCLEELEAIKEWINRRLDETGNGRSKPR